MLHPWRWKDFILLWGYMLNRRYNFWEALHNRGVNQVYVNWEVLVFGVFYIEVYLYKAFQLLIIPFTPFILKFSKFFTCPCKLQTYIVLLLLQMRNWSFDFGNKWTLITGISCCTRNVLMHSIDFKFQTFWRKILFWKQLRKNFEIFKNLSKIFFSWKNFNKKIFQKFFSKKYFNSSISTTTHTLMTIFSIFNISYIRSMSSQFL